MICGSELEYSRSLSLCMNMEPSPLLVKVAPCCMEMGRCSDFDASCEPKSALGPFIKVYSSGKDYKSEERFFLASTWVCSSPLLICFSLNKGEYYHFFFLFFWKGNRLSYLSNRNWQAVRKMSTMPSFFSCLQQTLVAIKQPVLPMPALRKGRAERGSGDVKRILELSCQTTANKPAQTPSSLLSLRPLPAGCFQMESQSQEKIPALLNDMI